MSNAGFAAGQYTTTELPPSGSHGRLLPPGPKGRAMNDAQGGADGGPAAAGIEWRVSSWCAAGDCVAVGRLPDGHVLVKDTKEPDGPQLRFDPTEWRAFVSGIRAGDFD